MSGKRNTSFWLYLKGEENERNALVNISSPSFVPQCKFCGSEQVVKYGHYRGFQRFWCKKCQRKFADNKAPPGMKIPRDQIAFALNMYYEGKGFQVVRQNLQMLYNSYISASTLYEWIERFAKMAIRAESKRKPEVCDVWIAEETQIKIGNKKAWFRDVFDAKTRFLLASHLSTKYTRDEYKLSLTKALKKAGKFPKVVISRHLADSINCLELKLGTNSKVIQARNLYASSGLKFLEIFHSSLRPRTQVLKGYKNLNSARIITQSWLVHYNYLKPNKILNNRTPAYTAGITTPLKIKIR